MMNILFAARDESWETYEPLLRESLAAEGIDAVLARDLAPDTVDYIVLSPAGPITDFAPFTRCRAVLNLWAGVEEIVGNQSLTQPLCRMVDPGLTEGMVEWVTAHVLRHHLGIDTHLHGQDGHWRPGAPPLARDRKVGILGLGELGLACATALARLNFNVRGWSRSEKVIEGLTTGFGDDGLKAVLARSEILVLLLPLTPGTRHLVNAESLDYLPAGAVLINPGRGPLIDDGALLAALETGQIGHATLDVFETEPLPPEHPFWAHPAVTVTPHIASATRPLTAAQSIAANIRRSEAGEALVGLVDRRRGY